MATITFGGTAGNWSDDTKWVGGVKPSQTDDAAFTSTSANCTYDVTNNNCTNIDFTGYTGTFTLSAAFNIYGSITFVTGMTLTVNSSYYFNFQGGNDVTLSTGGKDVKNMRFSKTTGNKVTFSDNITASGVVILITGGLDMNGKTVSMGSFATSGTSAKTLTLGAASVTLTASAGWDVETGGGTLTFSQSGSTITITGASRNFWGGGQTYGTVNFTTSGGAFMRGANTMGTLSFTGTGNTGANIQINADITVTTALTLNGNGGSNGINRMLVYTTPSGTSRKITYNGASITAQHVDFLDIEGAGTFGWDLSSITGGSGDGGNCTGITFTNFPDAYWIGNGGNWNAMTGGNYDHWAATDGGSAQGLIPLIHTTVHFTANSFSSASQTVTSSTTTMPQRSFGGCTWLGATNNPTWTASTALVVNNGTEFTLISGMTFNKTGSGISLNGRNNVTVTSAGKQLYALTVICVGATVTFLDNCQADTAATSLSRGVLDLNGKTVKLHSVDGSITTYARGMTFNGGTLELSNSTDILNFASSNFTLTSDTGTIYATNTGATIKRFTGGNFTYYNLKLAGGTNSVLQIVDANTFKEIEIIAPSKLSLPSGLTTNVSFLSMNGSDGSYCYLDAITPGTAATISSNMTAVSVHYCDIKDSTATGSAYFTAFGSIDNGGNTGWNFETPFSPRFTIVD